MIFLPPREHDVAWRYIVAAVLADRLGPSAKAATSEWNYRRDDEERLICVYTHDWQDRRDLLRVLKELRSMGFAGRLTYKTDADTERGIYGPQLCLEQMWSSGRRGPTGGRCEYQGMRDVGECRAAASLRTNEQGHNLPSHLGHGFPLALEAAGHLLWASRSDEETFLRLIRGLDESLPDEGAT
jgi:hypothetical protein